MIHGIDDEELGVELGAVAGMSGDWMCIIEGDSD